MIGRVHAYGAGVVAGTAILLSAQFAAADSGGASSSGGAPVAPTKTAPAPPLAPDGQVEAGNRVITASGNGITITTHSSALFRGRLRFTGHVSSPGTGRMIEIDRRGARGTWKPTLRTRIRAHGSFNATWATNKSGRFAFRASILRGKGQRATSASSPTLTVIVYRMSIATTYGPGFYGSQTACGERLTRHTLGTANRTLKCGTRVAVLYHGRSIVVPVIDRGPYANGANWDLTVATARKLGMDGTARIGAASLSAR
ncbi:MAG: hypothetical protein JOZ73_03210 [Solirubrobacterales bacterium]|nr:hypothetical protein [Solirubrobacterales bacterium]